MTKIMLVEDDKSLREIYGVRLLAEGYEIVSAGDGEEALAMAVKEHPDLILSDVMMPKISGFDMLDILRATPETKEIKVIMMTALSSEEQRTRGESLGANRYLVKSQVGIEDVVRAVHEVLEDMPVAQASAAQVFGAPVPTATINTQAPARTEPQAQPINPNPTFQATIASPSQPVAPIAPPQPVNQAPVVTVPTSPFPNPNPAVNQTDQNPVQANPIAQPQFANPNPTPSAPRPPITSSPRPISALQQTQTQPTQQPANMFATYNPAPQPQPVAQPNPQTQQAPAMDITNLEQPSSLNQPTNIAEMMAREINNTDIQPPINQNPPQL